MNKKSARLRRAVKARVRMRTQGKARLCVFRTPRHIYAQLISPDGARVLVSASTLDKQIRTEIANGGNKDAAGIVGQAIARRAQEAGIDNIAFDRSGFKFHGRIKALADAAKEHGMKF